MRVEPFRRAGKSTARQGLTASSFCLTATDRIRDIFIIVVALESLVIGVALIILIVQLASLINLLQNEVKPILHATNETVNTLRGTSEVLSENLVEPVIKVGGYAAGMKRMLELIGNRKK